MPFKKPAIFAELNVCGAQPLDVYKDTIRVHSSARGHVQKGKLARLSVNGNEKIVVVRGLENEHKNEIWLDNLTRDELGIAIGKTLKFGFQPVGWYGAIQWACRSADPATRIAAVIAVWSGLIGVIGILLSIFQLWQGWR